jgi:hypothetical protein
MDACANCSSTLFIKRFLKSADKLFWVCAACQSISNEFETENKKEAKCDMHHTMTRTLDDRELELLYIVAHVFKAHAAPAITNVSVDNDHKSGELIYDYNGKSYIFRVEEIELEDEPA